jgi:(1->4)-alpha-D-glucan 1-alpha-D-glucosylmutase
MVMLQGLRREIDRGGGHLAGVARELLDSPEDGRIKLLLISQALGFRRRRPDLFARGGYEPLDAEGARRSHLCAFARTLGDEQIVIAVPRLASRLVEAPDWPLGAATWADDRLLVPGEQTGARYRDVLSGEIIGAEARDGQLTLPLAAIFQHLPVAMLERLGD